ncbi:hypothetical protein ACEPAI_9829 [Sanghuangporus weigelae]
MTFYNNRKNSLVTHALFVSEFAEFSTDYAGALEKGKELSRYDNAIGPHQQQRLNKLMKKVKATRRGNESSMYGTFAALLTSISLDLTRIDTEQVLIFVPNSERRLASVHGSADSKPDLVAFLVERKIAERMISRSSYDNHISPAQSIVCSVELKVETSARMQCMRYMFHVSRHNPSSSIVYGLFANENLFQLFSLGLDHHVEWKEVNWADKDSIDKLYTCIDLIRDNAMKQIPVGGPKLISNTPFKVENYDILSYSADIDSRSFTLLPIFRGRGNGRKPFVAIAVPSHGEYASLSMVRIFKYAWYHDIQHGRERNLLTKLRGVPGVVQIDETLSRTTIDVDGWSGRKQSLLALKSIGYPLCSCTTVLEFLEAMYDLLEVLRYLVQEKDVLHRDISWGNVLIRPEHAPDVSIDFPSQPTNEPIPHTYRFISDIFSEEKRRVRVVLTDFDFASDLNDSSEEELKEATGTPMFMANDVLLPRQADIYIQSLVVQSLHTAVMDSSMKYSDDSERAAWNAFYSHLREIELIPAYPASDVFRHGAVHDAESVFYLCLLFFNRIRRSSRANEPSNIEEERRWGDAFATLAQKRVGSNLTSDTLRRDLQTGCDVDFVDLLSPINEYLGVPWYRAKSTGRGEQYEFHLHDFMQRLILKKIRELRQDGADPIVISDKPRKVRMRKQSENAYSSHSRGLASIISSQGVPRDLPSLMTESGDVQPIVRRTRSSIHGMMFKDSHLTLLMHKERERLWTTADKFA